MTHTDVIIIGAGLSGVAAAYYLQQRTDRTITILEGREAIGGTWDLFRYPGVRSDSSMLTLGYSFHPWPHEQAIAEGGDILAYIRQTAAAYGIDEKIQFGHRVVRADWNPRETLWYVEAEHDGQRRHLTCRFLMSCTGYYRYDQGYTPDWPTLERYEGCVVHPQHWPPDLDLRGKRVVIIGSGATAVTLLPELSQQAAHVTMLQRSPSYVVSRPAKSTRANWLRDHLPGGQHIARWRAILVDLVLYLLTRWFPKATKKRLIRMMQAELGPTIDAATHFTPTYNPWDQRVCLTPDSAFFDALKGERAAIVTDHIAAFTPGGIRLQSGRELPADVIVTATGLIMRMMHGLTLSIDGTPVELGERMAYKGAMLSGVPNLAQVFGYTNTSWTLKAELIAEYVCRLLNHMQEHGYTTCTPQPTPGLEPEPFIDFTSSYVQRAAANLPKQGERPPWRLYQNYLLDMLTLRYGPLHDGIMTFE